MARIIDRRNCPWNRDAGQIITILIQDMYRHIRRRRAPIEDIQIGLDVVGGRSRKESGGANPNKRRSSGGGARRSLWAGRPLWPGDVPLHELFVGVAGGAGIDKPHHPVSGVDACAQDAWRVGCEYRCRHHHNQNCNSNKRQTGDACSAQEGDIHTSFSSVGHKALSFQESWGAGCAWLGACHSAAFFADEGVCWESNGEHYRGTNYR